jgi:hypothetical protein
MISYFISVFFFKYMHSNQTNKPDTNNKGPCNVPKQMLSHKGARGGGSLPLYYIRRKKGERK